MLASLLSASGQPAVSAPRFAAMGASGVALRDLSSLLANQAGLTALKSAALAVYREDFTSSIARNSCIFAVPSGRSVVGVGIQSYGVEHYSEQRAAIALARRFGEMLSISIDFNIHRLSVSAYGNASAWSVETGFQYKISPLLTVAAHVSNPSRNTYKATCNAFVASRLEFGAAWQVSDKILLNAEASKDLDFGLVSAAGLEYQLCKYLFLRGGLSTEPFCEHLGFGSAVGSFSFECAVSVYEQFGYQPKVGLRYDF